MSSEREPLSQRIRLATLEAKEAGARDAIEGLPPDPNPTTICQEDEQLPRFLVIARYHEGYNESSEPLPF